MDEKNQNQNGQPNLGNDNKVEPVASEQQPVSNPEKIPTLDIPSEDSVTPPIPTANTVTPNPEPADSTSPTPTEAKNKKSGLNKKLIAIIAAVVAVLVVGASIFFFVLNRNTTSANIKVGLMMAFSGGASNMGYGASKGVQLAKKNFEADNIEIIQVDSKCDPKTAEEVVKDLINQGVVAIIGEGCSSASVAALPAVNNAKVPLISPSASSPTLSISDDYFFRVVPPDDLQGAFMARAIYDRGIRNVAVFYTNEPYGSGMNDVFRQEFEALGGKVVSTVSAEPDIIDLDSEIVEIRNSSPEAIFIAPNSVVTATAVMRVAREQGISVPFFGADIMYDSAIISNAPKIAEGLIISSFNTGTKAFRQAIVAEFQEYDPLYAAPQAYDIIRILQLANEQGAKTGEEIKNALPNISFEGVSGFRSFDINGEISDKTYQYDLFEVKDGSFALIEQGN